jgi:acyl-CoA hydrolase
MFSDGVVELVENGNITNAKKAIQTGTIISSFAVGTKMLYDLEAIPLQISDTVQKGTYRD